MTEKTKQGLCILAAALILGVLGDAWLRFFPWGLNILLCICTLVAALIVLLFCVMCSAVYPMRLYQQEYGLTEQRLYATAFMGWLAVVFVWLVLTVLRGRKEKFAVGALVAGYMLIAALHVLNPDALIVRVNAARAAAGRSFDASYASRLSADAVPTLVAALPIPSP